MRTSLFGRFCVTAIIVLLFKSPAAAEPRVLIPNAMDGTAIWRYTTEKPDANWPRPDFDDRKWSEGKSGFGVSDHVTPPATVGTPWKTSEIWLRKTIHVPGIDLQP